MEQSCKSCGKNFGSLKSLWFHEANKSCSFKCNNCDRNFMSLSEMKEHKDAKHRNEKWQVSPKFERNNKAVENICGDIVSELLEECFNKFGSEDIVKAINDGAKLIDDNNSTQASKVSSSSPVVGVWVADPSLPEGWKTCVIRKGETRYGGSTTPEKRMFYSPCGKLFSSRLSLDRFFEGQSVVGRQKKGKVQTRLPLKSPKSDVIRPADLCTPKVEAPDSEEEASDAISLSDEDFEEETKSKRKYDDESVTKYRKSKKIKLSEQDYDVSHTLTPAQEKILVECYEEWPLPFPDLVEQLVKDTGLEAWVIDDWFVRRTNRCLRMLFCQDT